jgi:methionyl-tRNA formyltransferase
VIVLAGKNNIAVHALNVLVDKLGDDRVVCICNVTDNGVDGWQRSFKSVAEHKNLQLSTLEDVYEMEDIELFMSLEFDKIIKPEKIKCDRLYNIHFSLLPQYKGMYTSFWPILNGERYSGVTLHEIDNGIDTGKIVDQIMFEIDRFDRCSDLYQKYITNSIKLFDKTIESLLESKPIAKLQDSVYSTYYSSASIDFKQPVIDLNVTAWALERQILAYSFRAYQMPCVCSQIISGVDISKERSTKKPGSVIEEDERSMVISTVDYNVRLYFDRLDDFLADLKDISLEEIKQSINNIAGVNDRNVVGCSPIIVASFHGRRDVIEYLLLHGADVNDVNYKGRSVLMYAKDYCLKFKDSTLFRWLLKAGANFDHSDYSGKTIRDYVSSNEMKFLAGI